MTVFFPSFFFLSQSVFPTLHEGHEGFDNTTDDADDDDEVMRRALEASVDDSAGFGFGAEAMGASMHLNSRAAAVAEPNGNLQGGPSTDEEALRQRRAEDGDEAEEEAIRQAIEASMKEVGPSCFAGAPPPNPLSSSLEPLTTSCTSTCTNSTTSTSYCMNSNPCYGHRHHHHPLTVPSSSPSSLPCPPTTNTTSQLQKHLNTSQ
jgi:hypothetical protein